jgi:hypothetical protein
MRTPGQPGYGLPPREPIVDIVRDIADLRSQMAALQSAQANATRYQSFSADAGSLSFPSGGGYSAYAVTNAIIVPPGITAALIFVTAYAGCTFSTAGSISVGIGTASTPGGPWATVNAIGNGTAAASACSVNSTDTRFDTGLVPGTITYLSAMVAVNGTSGATGNAHINGIVMWSRAAY